MLGTVGVTVEDMIHSTCVGQERFIEEMKEMS